jgi:hypothetical protein
VPFYRDRDRWLSTARCACTHHRSPFFLDQQVRSVCADLDRLRSSYMTHNLLIVSEASMRLFPCVALHVIAAVAGEDVATWTTKPGFIPGTKSDVETGFMTVEEGKRRCAARNDCLAITFRDVPDVVGKVHVYLKPDSTVSDSDKTWTSMIKRPAGLMDVNFYNPLTIPLELCWIAIEGGAKPACYGTVAPGSNKNMSSFDGHHFILKRMAWSSSVSDVLGASSDVPITARESRIEPAETAID